MTAAKILALMLMLIPARAQQARETEGEARARYAVIANAIAAEAGQDARLTRFLLTVARHESSFRLDIHSGKLRGDGGRSWGLYQIMVGRDRYRLLRGQKFRAYQIVGASPEATRRATKAAAFYLRPIIKRCAGEPMCVFKAYGGVSQTVGGKTLERLRARVKTYGRLR